MTKQAPRIFQGSRVFIGLRPKIFNTDDEHITLEYVGTFPEWNALTAKCERWHRTFGYGPVTVEVNGYANWAATNNGDSRYFDVALVGFKEYPELTYAKNWHITLGKDTKPVKPRQFDRDNDAFRYDICDDIWIGYKDMNGDSRWLRYMGSTGTFIYDELDPSLYG
jgi:hypothetical protein